MCSRNPSVRRRSILQTGNVSSTLHTDSTLLRKPYRDKTHEDTPLVLSLGRSMKPPTRAALHTMVRRIFASAAEGHRLRGDGLTAQADLLYVSNEIGGILQAPTWPTATPICVQYATTCGTRRSRARTPTCTRPTMNAIARQKKSTG